MERIIDNKYEIIERIGAGGTSVVYKAVRLEDHALVAIKVLREELSENAQQVERFLRESKTLNNLSHPNIVNILDMGQMQNGKDYIVMEYIDGMTLKEYIQQNKYLNFDRIVELAEQMCEALGYAHDHGVIHRDIKPQNILLDKEGVARIADFGTARIVDQNTLTMAGRDVVGSVHYISPEQAKGGIIDSRSDLYSFGITLFEMATGMLPFTGDDAITVAMKHINQSPRRPYDVNPDIPKCLSDIILKCMSKDPLKRYQNAYELREDLLEAQKNPDGFFIYTPKTNGVSDAEGKGETMGKSNKNKRRKKKQSRRERWQFIKNLAILVLILVLLIGGLTALFVSLFSGSGQVHITNNDVTVENWVGKDYSQALEWVKRMKLRTPAEPTYIYSDDIPEGQVVSQSLAEGAVVKEHEQIFFEVCGGPQKVKMPLLKNLSEEDAVKAITDAGLVVGEIHYEKTEEHTSLKVFRQSIEQNEMVLLNTKVDIWIAKSSLQKKRVPNVIGLREDPAKEKILDNNFSFGGIEYVYSDTYAEGKIVRQEPGANVEFEYDAPVSVKIFISKGPAVHYYGVVEIDIPEITVPTDVKITYIDDNKKEIVVIDEQVVNSSTFAPDGKWRSSGDSESGRKRKYYLYINGVKKGTYDMVFTDADGNPAA